MIFKLKFSIDLSKCYCTFQGKFILYLFCIQWPIPVYGWPVNLCACSIQPGPAAPVQRGRPWSMALVLTPLSQVRSLTLLRCSFLSLLFVCFLSIWGSKRTWKLNDIYIHIKFKIHFIMIKVSCADLPVRMEDVAWPMKKETGVVTAGLVSLGSAVKSTIVQITA